MREKGFAWPLVLVIVALVVVVFGVVGYFLLQERLIRPPVPSGPVALHSGEAKTTSEEKPPIVDHFACSDYCPGPKEKYMVKIYKGIENPQECRAIGGKPHTYYGWGEFRICIAE